MNRILFLTLFSKGIINGVDWRPIADFPINSPEEINSRAVVEVFNERGEVCNGVIVGNDFVYSAGHCSGNKITIQDRLCRIAEIDNARDIVRFYCAGLNSSVKRSGTITKKIYVLHYQCEWTRFPYCKNKMMYSPGEIVSYDKDFFTHTADTLGGSSGSPVFNEHHELIGIHTRHNENAELNMGSLLK